MKVVAVRDMSLDNEVGNEVGMARMLAPNLPGTAIPGPGIKVNTSNRCPLYIHEGLLRQETDPRQQMHCEKAVQWDHIGEHEMVEHPDRRAGDRCRCIADGKQSIHENENEANPQGVDLLEIPALAAAVASWLAQNSYRK
jgi:hypothetical protein